MKTPSVLIHSDDHALGAEVLSHDHPDVPVAVCGDFVGLAESLRANRAEVVFSTRFRREPFPREALLSCPTVRWISVGGSGTDHLRPWDPSAITVTNAACAGAALMAEYVFGMMLSFSLDLPRFDRQQRDRRWEPHPLTRLQDQTILIVGMGATGSAVAHRAKAFGMTVLGVRARPRPTADFDEVPEMDALAGLWCRADIVLCCVPLLDATRGLVGREAFASMRPSAILIDVSRGGVVDGKALGEALDTGRIKGAACDVFEEEPLPADHPLWASETLRITPHCSSVDEGWSERVFRMFSQNLGAYRRGEPLSNVVDPARGY